MQSDALPTCSRRVEQALKGSGCGLVWVSHDPEQPARVGGRLLELPAGIMTALPSPAAELV